MRDNLIGYLLDALEPAEQELVEARLASDPELRRELDVLSRALRPLEYDKEPHEPPPGLAYRTCDFVAQQTHVAPAPSPSVVSVPSRWSMADLVVAAGIFLAATMLFFPALNQSRFAARLIGCQNNMRQIGHGLASYAELNNKQFPTGHVRGSLSGSGMYAVLLQENKLIPQVHVFICPGSDLALDADSFNVPTCRDLTTASGDRLVLLRRKMGGSYGFSLGYVSNGRYQPPRDLRRANRALLADAPHIEAPNHDSRNHGGYGQNVLFEDLSVRYLEECKACGCDDHIFENDAGKFGPGLHSEDDAIAPSEISPADGLPMQLTPLPVGP